MGIFPCKGRCDEGPLFRDEYCYTTPHFLALRSRLNRSSTTGYSRQKGENKDPYIFRDRSPFNLNNSSADTLQVIPLLAPFASSPPQNHETGHSPNLTLQAFPKISAWICVNPRKSALKVPLVHPYRPRPNSRRICCQCQLASFPRNHLRAMHARWRSIEKTFVIPVTNLSRLSRLRYLLVFRQYKTASSPRPRQLRYSRIIAGSSSFN
jgi:hypothetical protein